MASPAPSSSQGSDRIAALDAVRGIAALAVLWNHYYLAFGIKFATPFLNTPIQIFADGYAAVILFFVLSGYVLSFRQFGTPGLADFDLLGFWAKRACRIILPFLAVLLASYLLWETLYQVHADNHPALTGWGKRQWADNKVILPLSEYLKSALMILPDTRFPLIPQAWTLKIEMGMSLFLPFMVLLAIRSGWWLATFVVVAITVLNVYIYLAHFAMGILLAMHRERICSWLAGRTVLWLSLLALGVVLYGFRFPPALIAVKLPPDILRLVVGVGSCILLILVLSSKRTQVLLEMRVFQFLGRVSYSLYLVHLAVILTFSEQMIHWLTGLGLPENFNFWATMLATTAVALALAQLCFRIVEQPSINLGRLLANSIAKVSK